MSNTYAFMFGLLLFLAGVFFCAFSLSENLGISLIVAMCAGLVVLSLFVMSVSIWRVNK